MYFPNKSDPSSIAIQAMRGRSIYSYPELKVATWRREGKVRLILHRCHETDLTMTENTHAGPTSADLALIVHHLKSLQRSNDLLTNTSPSPDCETMATIKA